MIQRSAGSCLACGEAIAFPTTVEEDLFACYECLRRGRAAISKDTEIGAISWTQAYTGLPNRTPVGLADDDELLPLATDRAALPLPRESLLELLRTPTYSTWHGERWLICCKVPMTFVGAWKPADFVRLARGGDPKTVFERIVENPAADLWAWDFPDDPGVYVFRCALCARLRAHWDMA